MAPVARPARPIATDTVWWLTAALLPIGTLYVHGMGMAAPVYVAGGAFIAVALALRALNASGFCQLPGSYLALAALALYSLASDVLRGQVVAPNTGNLLLGMLAPLLVFRADIGGCAAKTLRRAAWVAVALIALDRLVQFTPYQLPFYEDEVVADATDAYYEYKSSYLAGDSNSIGLFLVPIFAVLYRTARAGRLQRALEYALQLLTFSKASIVAIAARDFVSARIRRATKLALAGAAVAALVLAAGAAGDLDLGRSVDSALLKFETFQMFAELVARADPLSLLFGAGNNMAKPNLGIYLHAWPLTVTYELGLVGLLLMVLYLVLSYRESPAVFRVLHLPVFLLAGLSFFFYVGSMWIYLPHYLLLTLERHGSQQSAPAA